MIAQCLRLRRAYDFMRARRHGRTWTTPLLVLAVYPNGLPHNRYGFAVGRRIGKAAKRNRVKRRLREIVREAHPELKQGHDIVLIARGPLADPLIPYAEIRRSARSLFRRSKLLSAPQKEQN